MIEIDLADIAARERLIESLGGSPELVALVRTQSEALSKRIAKSDAGDARLVLSLLDGLAFSVVAHRARHETQRRVNAALHAEIAELRAALPHYAGTWEEGTSYAKHAIVSRHGSGWIAEREPTGQPGEPDSGWTLFVKRGRDGKDWEHVASERHTARKR